MGYLQATNKLWRSFRDYGSNLNSSTVIATLYLANEKKITFNEDAEALLNDSTLSKDVIDKAIAEIKSELTEQFVPYKQVIKELFEISESRSGFGANRQTNIEYDVATLIAKLFKFEKKDSVLDVGSGNAAAIIQFSDVAEENKINIRLSGIEINNSKVIISRLLTDLLDISARFEQGDIFHVEIPNYDKCYVYPPFGMIYSSVDSNSALKEQYSDLFNFKGNSEWMFIFRLLNSLKDNGKIISLLPLGPLFRSSSTNVRKYLIENGLIEGIILLPNNTLSYTSIPTVIFILSKNNKSFKLLDASEMIETIDDKRKSVLNIDRILEAYNNEYSNIDYKKVEELNYSLNPTSYIEQKGIEIPYPVKINEISSIEAGSQYTAAKFKDAVCTKSNYQILTSSDIQNGIVDYDSLTYIDDNEKLLKFALKENDMVITTKSTKVKTFVARNLPNRNIIVTGGMIILHPDTNKIDPTFLKMFLDSESGQALMRSIMRGVTIKTIPFKDFKEMLVSCPPLEEQHKFSRKYNNLLAMYEGIQQQLTEIQTEIDEFYETNVKDGE